MGFLDLASGQSFWKGMDYYEQLRVENVIQINPQLFESEVEGSKGKRYHVTMNVKQPKKSTCNCAFAQGRRVICKHMVATYLTQFPREVARVLKEIEEDNEKIDAENQDRRVEIKEYVFSLSKQELRDRLLRYMLDEMSNRNQFYD